MYNYISRKKASYDGSTMIARNDDAGGNHFTAKICDRTSGGAAEGVQICDLSCGDPAFGASHALQRSSMPFPDREFGQPAV